MSAAVPHIHPDRLARHEARHQLIQKQQQQQPKPRPPSPTGARRPPPSARASSPPPRRSSGPPLSSGPGQRRPPSPSAARRRSGTGRFPPKRETSSPSVPIDREKVCPLLLRVFIKENGAFSADDFAFDLSQLTPNEMQVYTWKDATLRELVEAIRSAKPSARASSSKFEVSFAYPIPGGVEVRRVGSLHAGRAGSDDQLTLARLRFETGDFLAVSVFT